MLDNAKINDFISDAFEDNLHAKRIASLANAVQGAIHDVDGSGKVAVT